MWKLIVVLALSSLAFAYGVTCPLHPAAQCWKTGNVSQNGQLYEYQCSCGDTTWAR